MDIIDIIKSESTNRCYLYLYRYKVEAWGCCGYSAKLLHQLYPNIYYSEKPVSGWSDALPVTVIDLLTLEHLLDNFPPKERSMERIVIEMPDAYMSFLQ